MGKRSRERMTGLSLEERRARRKGRIGSYLWKFRRGRNSGLANNRRDGKPRRLPVLE